MFCVTLRQQAYHSMSHLLQGDRNRVVWKRCLRKLGNVPPLQVLLTNCEGQSGETSVLEVGLRLAMENSTPQSLLKYKVWA